MNERLYKMRPKNKIYIKIFQIILFFFIVCNSSLYTKASSDNSLSELKIKSVKLAPDFKYNHLKYSGTVDANVSEVKVVATTSNKAAKIISISGNTDLKTGINIIKIVVESKNKKRATYEIELTKKEGDVIANTTENKATADTDTKADNASKANTKKLSAKEKLKLKNAEIKSLKSEITAKDDAINTLQTKYKNALEYNTKLNSKNMIYTILIVVLLFALAVSLFIGLIKKSTNKFIESEFDDISSDKKINTNSEYIISKASEKSIIKNNIKTNSSSNNDYAKIENNDFLNEDRLDNIINELKNEERLSKGDVNINNVNISLNEPKIHTNKKNINMKDIDANKKNDDFSFDIIDL